MMSRHLTGRRGLVRQNYQLLSHQWERNQRLGLILLLACIVINLPLILTAPNRIVLAETVTTDAKDRAKQASLNPRLAWISTGNAGLDSEIENGLKTLTGYLWQRTSITLAPPVSVDPAIDALTLYPLIYWGLVSIDSVALPDQAINPLREFLRQGGLLLIDTRQADPYQQQSLHAIEPILKPPRLIPLHQNHVLLRSFYILPDLMGRYGRGKSWITQSEGRHDVASLIITNIDFAGAWATRSDGRPRYAVFPGFDRQREFSYRSGINIVMYALNGNYKADQIHIGTILDRLTQ